MRTPRRIALANWTAEITDLDFTTATITVRQGGVVVLERTVNF